jgi:hypothetical protein
MEGRRTVKGMYDPGDPTESASSLRYDLFVDGPTREQ